MGRTYTAYPGTLTEIINYLQKDGERLVALTPDNIANAYWGITVNNKGMWEYDWFLTEPRLIIEDMQERAKDGWRLVAMARHIRSDKEDYDEMHESPEEDTRWNVCRAVVERRIQGEMTITAKTEQAVENVEVSA